MQKKSPFCPPSAVIYFSYSVPSLFHQMPVELGSIRNEWICITAPDQSLLRSLLWQQATALSLSAKMVGSNHVTAHLWRMAICEACLAVERFSVLYIFSGQICKYGKEREKKRISHDSSRGSWITVRIVFDIQLLRSTGFVPLTCECLRWLKCSTRRVMLPRSWLAMHRRKHWQWSEHQDLHCWTQRRTWPGRSWDSVRSEWHPWGKWRPYRDGPCSSRNRPRSLGKSQLRSHLRQQNWFRWLVDAYAVDWYRRHWEIPQSSPLHCRWHQES